MERSFTKEVRQLRLGDGQMFHGEGILAVTKALLQSGVSYVGGYQGAPVSHVMDVLNDAHDLLDELGVLPDWVIPDPVGEPPQLEQVTVDLATQTIHWTVTGDESQIDHFTIDRVLGHHTVGRLAHLLPQHA